MTNSSTRSLCRLSQQVGISYGTAHGAVRKNMCLYPYCIFCQHELKDTDFESEDDVLEKTFFSDEAWFHLSGYVSSQNS